MPRSSKHKSGKHGSREYSDSERDSGLKDHRKGKDENAVAKTSRDSVSGEKRKLDSKDGTRTGNGEYLDEYSSSKRSKERSGDGGSGGGGGERWTGGEDGRGERSKKAAKVVATGDSMSRRRDESVGMYGSEVEEVKKSGGKHHKDSGRKDSREGTAVEKERKVKEGRSERSVDNEEQRMSKQNFENTDSNVDELRSPEFDNQLERRTRKKRDSGDGDKHQDDAGDDYDRRLSSRDEIAKDGRQKDEKRKDEKYKDKCREEMDNESKHRHDKQRDEHPAKDRTSIKSDDKHAREEKDSLESRPKRTKLLESDRDRDHNRDRDGDQDRYLESGRDCERHNERVHDHDYDLDRDYDYDRDRYWDRDHDHDRDRDRYRHREHDRRRDRDVSHVDDHSARSKESVTKKRTSDRDDYTDTKSRVIKGQYTDGEKRSLSSSRADSDVDRGRSQPRQAYADSTGTTNKHRSSPASNTRIGKDEYRNANSDDTTCRDSMIEQITKGSREGYSGISERGPKHKSMEKPIKIDDGPVGDLSTERSSIVKAASMGLMERSSTSIERRYMNKSGVRQSLEIEESGRRNSINARDFSTSDDRLYRELTLEKPLLEAPSQAESSSYGRTNQGNASLIPPLPAFRAALDRPFMGSLEDDVRDNSSSRYRRNSDPGFDRGHGNSRRAVPNWTSPVPNGFVSFQPGPAHGGFQTMMPRFTSQPLFGVRPSMEVNCAGIPYHITDANRFPGHLRPLGWQNVMDGTGPAHLHGWESNNGAFRDDPHMYGISDWDQNRHSTNSRGWESGSETWKEHNGDSKKDLPSPACKDESVPAQVDDDLTNQATHMSGDDEHNQDEFHEKSPGTKLSGLSSPVKVPLNSLSATVLEKLADSSTPSDNTSLFSRFYLSKLDISADLVIPELYDQCMCLVNVDKNASSTAGASAKLFQKNGLRAQKKYAATFSAIDNSIFQRAIDLYKKQRVELPNRGTVDIISASNQVQVDESVPRPSLENRQVSASVSHGMEDVPKSTLEPKKMEALSPAKEHLEAIDQPCIQKEQDQDCSHSLKPVMSSQSSSHEKQREPVAGLGEKEDKVTSDKLNSGDAEENNPMAFKHKSQLAPTLHEDGDNMNSIAKTTDFAHHADEKLGFGDTMVSPLIFEDGSPKACDALMPGSNESESLILSRIHHSPESTH